MTITQPLYNNDCGIRVPRHARRLRRKWKTALLREGLSRIIGMALRLTKITLDHSFYVELPAKFVCFIKYGGSGLLTAAASLLLVSSTHTGIQTIIPMSAPRSAPAAVKRVRTPASHIAVARYIAKRFHVDPGTADQITQQAYLAAKANGLKPAVILAVAAVESGYHPTAVNTKSGARGLMQILPHWHRTQVRRAGGVQALLKIGPNIHVGAEILATYLHRSGGQLSAALLIYCGHANYEEYVKRVKTQLKRIRAIIARAASSRPLGLISANKEINRVSRLHKARVSRAVAYLKKGFYEPLTSSMHCITRHDSCTDYLLCSGRLCL